MIVGGGLLLRGKVGPLEPERHNRKCRGSASSKSSEPFIQSAKLCGQFKLAIDQLFIGFSAVHTQG